MLSQVCSRLTKPTASIVLLLTVAVLYWGILRSLDGCVATELTTSEERRWIIWCDCAAVMVAASNDSPFHFLYDQKEQLLMEELAAGASHAGRAGAPIAAAAAAAAAVAARTSTRPAASAPPAPAVPPAPPAPPALPPGEWPYLRVSASIRRVTSPASSACFRITSALGANSGANLS